MTDFLVLEVNYAVQVNYYEIDVNFAHKKVIT